METVCVNVVKKIELEKRLHQLQVGFPQWLVLMYCNIYRKAQPTEARLEAKNEHTI